MASVSGIVERMSRNPKDVRLADACRVCEHYFGPPRQKSTSHVICSTPWPGGPRVNIQNAKGKAKAYQVKQILRAIEGMEHEGHPE